MAALFNFHFPTEQEKLQNELLKQELENQRALQQRQTSQRQAMMGLLDNPHIRGSIPAPGEHGPPLPGLLTPTQIDVMRPQVEHGSPQQVSGAFDILTGAAGLNTGNGNRVLGATDIVDPGTGKIMTVVPTVRNGQISNLTVGESARQTPDQRFNQKLKESQLRINETSAKKRAESSVTRNQNLINRGIAANEQLPRLRRMATLLDRIQTGGFSAVQKAATDFFGTTPPDIGEFNNLAGQVIVDALQAFSGAISDGERGFVERVTVGLKQGKAVNARDLGRLIQIAENARTRALKRAQALGDQFAIEDLQPLADIVDTPQANATGSASSLSTMSDEEILRRAGF